MLLVRAVAFLATFLFLACTITAISAAMYETPKPIGEPVPTEEATQAKMQEETQAPTEEVNQPPEKERETIPEVDEHTQQTESYTPRMSAPEADNPCYYSDENIFYAADYGMPNCTCYAWGRAYEISGEHPDLSPGDACTWYGYNAENGIYDYGDVPQEGAIACWAYSDGGSGHVAVVEQVDEDTVLLSNSAYSGAEFYMDTVPADDPAEGRDGWIFQGYIYVNGDPTDHVGQV